MRTFSISFLILVGIYFVSYFSFVADRIGMKSPADIYVQRLAVSILPHYQLGLEKTAIALENRESRLVERRTEFAQKPQDNVATVGEAFEKFKREFVR